MRKHDLIESLSRGLVALGWTAKHVRRVAREVSDHWDDLEAEAREGGLDDAAAARFAFQQIGEPATLIRFHQSALRQAHWSGRHPILSFAVLPPVALALWFLAWVLMAAGAGEVYGQFLHLPHWLWESYLAVFAGIKVIHYTGVFAVPAFFWWWARRSFCGFKWSWIACGVCALHGLINHVTVQEHSLRWGYGWAVPDGLPVLAPLIVAGIAHCLACQKQSHWRALTAVVLTTFAAGCATAKVPQQRGWIGGEYKQIKGTEGLLLAALATNTPAAQSGLQEGDLILRGAGRSVDDAEDFHKIVDAASPGTALPLTVLRDGATFDAEVVVGREVLKPSRALTVGLLFSQKWDLWPNPDFSLIALGYQRQHKRVELASPESRLKLASRKDKSTGLRSAEGWEVWLPICSFSSRKRILSQTAAE